MENGHLVSCEELNKSFGIKNRVTIYSDKSDLPWVRLQFGSAFVEICLQGAHVNSYCPSGKENILWTSSTAVFEKGKAIRGGIPLCWPWFGPHAENAERPQHGYARNSLFSLTSAAANEEDTRILLSLDPDDAPFPEWIGVLELEVEIRLSEELWIEMRTRNLSRHTTILSQALHSYFGVSDVRNIQISQLHNCWYLDKLRNYKKLKQIDPFQVSREVDRVYQDVEKQLGLVDLISSKTIDIQTWGNSNIVVWNPWIEQAQKMGDFEDDGYSRMLCLEPANALAQSVTLLPNMQHGIGLRIKPVQ